MENLLEIKDLNVIYKTDEATVHALNDFTLSVKKGETLGLVGETGAGKTTMCLSALRLLPAQVGEVVSGSIRYRDIDILKASVKQMRKLRGAEISMVFQDPMSSLNPVMRIGDQIKEVLNLHFPDMSPKQKDKKVDEVLKLVGITPERKDQFPHQFSGGMKQRVVIAMALVAEPKLLLADEPTTALDVTIQAQILALMRELKDKFDSAMVLVTHDLGIVAEFCESVAVAYAGEIVENGTIQQVFECKQNHPYTSGLFHCIPDLTSTAKRLTPIPGHMPNSRELPKGCKFANRCSHCTQRCLDSVPEMYEVQPGHFIKCYMFAEGERKV